MRIKSIREALRGNSYPGRGILIGTSACGKFAIFAYFIMGRSENSRNRVFVPDSGGLRTRAYDPSKIKDPSLIIYWPVRTLGGQIIVTNGDQTDTIYDFLSKGKSFEDALRTRVYEPDAPNFTPRVSGLLSVRDGGYSYKLSIIKNGGGESPAAQRFFYEYEAVPGTAHLIHTYVKDGNPLPSFGGDPKTIKLSGDFEKLAGAVWDSLDEENRVSLVVHAHPLSGGLSKTIIFNKHEGGKPCPANLF